MSMVAVGAGVAAGGAAIQGNQNRKAEEGAAGRAERLARTTKNVDTMNKDQKYLMKLLIANSLGVDVSILTENKDNLKLLMQSGEFDDILKMTADNPRIAEKVYQGDRIADLTPAQKSIIGSALNRTYSFQDTAAMFKNLDETGEVKQVLQTPDAIEKPFQPDTPADLGEESLPEGAQLVGEDGAEVLDPNQPVDIIPAEETSSMMDKLRHLTDMKGERIESKTDVRIAEKTKKTAKRKRQNQVKIIEAEEKLAKQVRKQKDLDDALLESGGILPDKFRTDAKIKQKDVQDSRLVGMISGDESQKEANKRRNKGISDEDKIAAAIARGDTGQPSNADEMVYAQVFNPETGRDSFAPYVDPSGDNPLGTETNTVGLDPDALIDETGLPAKADGGLLNEGQKAVVGEEGPELAVPAGSMGSAVQSASKRALSGKPSSTINTGTTEGLIKNSIVDPMNRQFRESTLPSIGASTAGAGFSGSQRVKATQRATDQLQNSIIDKSSRLRYDDELSRRDLAESAANRSAGAVSTGLNVQNQDLTRRSAEAAIDSTRANTADTEFATKRGEALLGSEVRSAEVSIESALKGLALSDAAMDRLKSQARTDLLEQDRFSQDTINMFKEGGLKDLEIEGLEAEIKAAKTGEIAARGKAIADNNKAISDHYVNLLGIAGIEQDQAQAEINADIDKLAEENQALADIIRGVQDLISETTFNTITGAGD